MRNHDDGSTRGGVAWCIALVIAFIAGYGCKAAGYTLWIDQQPAGEVRK